MMALGPAGKSPLVFAPDGAKKSTKKTYIETILELREREREREYFIVEVQCT